MASAKPSHGRPRRCFLSGVLVAAALLPCASEAVQASPWNDPEWRDSSAVMQLYICGAPHTRADWCSETTGNRLAYRITTYDKAFGPPIPADLARWRAFVAGGELSNPAPADVELIRRRATTQADPLAMEALGFLLFNGIAMQRDLAEAYLWYARAVLAGQADAAGKRDLVWQLLVQENPLAARRLVERYRDPSAQSQGLSDSLAAAPAEAALEAAGKEN